LQTGRLVGSFEGFNSYVAQSAVELRHR